MFTEHIERMKNKFNNFFSKNDVLSLDDYERKIAIFNQYSDNLPTFETRYTYYHPKTKEKIGYIHFTPETGGIEFWGIHEDYQHKTLGKQMIEAIIPECKKYNVNKITGYSDAEEIRKMSENNTKIKRIKRKGFDYYEMNI